MYMDVMLNCSSYHLNMVAILVERLLVVLLMQITKSYFPLLCMIFRGCLLFVIMLVDNWIFCSMQNIFLDFLITVGKIRKADLEQLQIGNSNIQCSNSVKCVGITCNFCSGKRLVVDSNSTIRKLYASANAVLVTLHCRYVFDLIWLN